MRRSKHNYLQTRCRNSGLDPRLYSAPTDGFWSSSRDGPCIKKYFEKIILIILFISFTAILNV